VTIRPLAGESDWAQALANQIRCRDPEHAEAGYRLFKERQMARYRAMTAAGWGAWFGAFVGEQLVADFGAEAERAVTEHVPDPGTQAEQGKLVETQQIRLLRFFSSHENPPW